MTIQTFTNLITASEAAKLLGIKPDTLAVWRCTKRYKLPYVKVGSRVLYRADDVQKFIEVNLHESFAIGGTL